MNLKSLALAGATLTVWAANLWAQSPPTITIQPTSQTVMAGGSAIFSVAVSGTEPFTYQWQWNGTNLPNGIITTVAGKSSSGYFGDGGAATNARLSYPYGIAVDASGNLFIADYNNNRIRKVDSNGMITTVAGNGSSGYSGDGGAATNASLYYPSGVAVDASGNLFIADRNNNRIRKVDLNGIITTVTGNGSPGYSGDGDMATNASLHYPSGVAMDASSNLFIADYGNYVIRKADPNGIITTVAGNGNQGYSGDGGMATNASLTRLFGIAVDASSNLFIADFYNNRIRKVDPTGMITTVAGNGSYGYSGDGGAATNASLYYPAGVAVDASGNLFIADTGNSRLRNVNPNGIITTVAGNGSRGYSGDGGAATNASLYYPDGVAVDASANLFIADTGNNRIRRVMSFFSHPTLTLNNVTPNNAGNYNVIITGPYGSVTSSIVTLTVVYIVSQPQSLIVTNGSLASFSVSVSGPQPLDCQWQQNGTNLTDGGNISGSATTNLLLSSTTTNDAGNYTVIITCPYAYGSITSKVANLAVMLPPTITTQQINQTVMAGGTATFSVAVSGTGPFTYQWQLNGTNLPNGIITTVAGNGSSGYSGDGGAATNASLYYSAGVAVDAFGNLFMADTENNRVRKVDPTGMITTVAGNGSHAYSGDGGMATNASLSYPKSAAVDASGNLFIADYDNSRIRKVNPNGMITTVAGGGPNSPGDGGAATNASLSNPNGVAVDAFGNLFIADTYNSRIRKVNPNGIITTVAGYGTNGYSGDGGIATNARLSYPFGVAVDAFGNLFIADYDNFRIRKVDPNGMITTVAGNGSFGYSGDGGAATNASLGYPNGVAVDAFGNLFIANRSNNRIRKVDPNGMITTVAGNGSHAYSGDGGMATNASLSEPYGVAVDASGNLFIADIGNNRIREVMLFAGHPTFTLNNVTTNNAGNYTVIITSPYVSVTSSIVTLTVVSPIASQPQSLIADYGATASFSVSVSGTLPLDFQWQKNGTNLTDGGNVSGSLTTKLVLTNVNFNDAGNYTVIITCPDASGSVTSSKATLTVVLPIVSQPQSLIVTDGSPASFSVSVSGTSSFIYQWEKNGTNLTDGGNISGSLTTNLVLTNVSSNDAGNYAVIITCPNDYGNVASNVASSVASLAVVLPPELSSQTVMAGGTAIFSVAVSGDGPFTYQWQRNGAKLPNGAYGITTVAGNGFGSYSGDGSAATNASLYYPYGLAVDASGNLFIADLYNNRIRKVDTNGMITTVAGVGPSGGLGSYSGDGGAATNASLDYPYGVAVDASGNLFIADLYNNRIRKVDPNGMITTVAGNGTNGYSGDGGAATNASLYYPYGIAVDASGNLFIADYNNNRIRKVNPNGIITTVAGNGSLGYSSDGGAATNASLNWPSGVAVDASGNLFIADTGNNRIRKVDPTGMITTVAGNGSSGYSGDGGLATNASLVFPSGVAVDASGNLFIVDSDNNRIRKVNPNGIIMTVAGNGSRAYSGDNGAAINASLNSPFGVGLDASGNLFIADTDDNRIREVVLFGSYPTLTLHNITTKNAGNYTVIITSPYGSITSSIVTLTVVVRPAISGMVPNLDGSATLSFSGGAGETYLVQAATNLMPPVVWQTLSTNVAGTNGTWQFTDAGATNCPMRFYRARTP